MKKLLCIDGNSILNRQFFGIRFLSAKDGFPTNAIFGFVNVLTRQLESLAPDYIAVAFDLRAPTFRHKMYAEYKAGRKPSPEDLIKQFPAAKDICRAMGISVLELEGYEADDILGTLSKMAENADEETEAYVLTGDRDSLQLISDKTRVLLATNTDTVVFDRAAFFEKYGVEVLGTPVQTIMTPKTANSLSKNCAKSTSRLSAARLWKLSTTPCAWQTASVTR